MSLYTYTGKTIDPLDVSENDIELRDIAHALSLLCRASGQFKHFYSVAQHSINCMREAYARGFSQRVCFLCLLHDASEAYIVDVPRPIKELLPKYIEIEAKFQEAVFKRFSLCPVSESEKRMVSMVDDAVLWYEFRNIHTIPLCFDKRPNLASRPDVSEKTPESVEQMFLREAEAFIRLKLSA